MIQSKRCKKYCSIEKNHASYFQTFCFINFIFTWAFLLFGFRLFFFSLGCPNVGIDVVYDKKWLSSFDERDVSYIKTIHRTMKSKMRKHLTMMLMASCSMNLLHVLSIFQMYKLWFSYLALFGTRGSTKNYFLLVSRTRQFLENKDGTSFVERWV